MANTSVHQKEKQTTFPVGSSVPRGTLVVSQLVVKATEMQGHVRQTSQYFYAGFREHYQGLGSLGFRKVTITDCENNHSITKTFSQKWQLRTVGNWISEENRVAGNLLQTRKRSVTARMHGKSRRKVYQVYSPRTEAKDFDLDGRLLASTTSSVVFDRYNNPLLAIVEERAVINGQAVFHREVSTAKYQNLISDKIWILGLVTKETVRASSTYFKVPLTKRIHYVYNRETGQLVSRIKEPFQSNLKLTTKFKYDGFGNLRQTKYSWINGTASDGRVKYDRLGRFKISQSNSKGQKEWSVYNSGTGGLLTLTGPNGLRVVHKQDPFGNPIQKIHGDNSKMTVSKMWCSDTNVCPLEGVVAVTSTSICGTNTTLVHDAFGRILRTAVVGFKGRPIYSDVIYDSAGNVARESNPYFEGEQVHYTRSVYDSLGRPLKVISPSGDDVTTYLYDGLTTYVSDALGGRESRLTNGRGELIRSTDKSENSMRFRYDPYGNMIELINSKGETIRMKYDIRGNKVEVDDPNAGKSRYEYNALGLLMYQADSSGAWIRNTYDKLGRVIAQRSTDSLTIIQYDSQKMGIGKVSRIRHTRYAGPSFKTVEFSYEESYQYNHLGLKEKIVATVNEQSYEFTQRYDFCGRTASIIYPGRFEVRHVYDKFSGSLFQTIDAETDSPLWEAIRITANGIVTAEMINSRLRIETKYDQRRSEMTGVVSIWADSSGEIAQQMNLKFDAEGNLLQREDRLRGLKEEARYDKMSRLIEATVISKKKAVHTLKISYDPTGNILYKSDVGRYSYGFGGWRPDAVSSVLLNDGSRHFLHYDDAGKIVSGFGRKYTYTGAGKTKSIVLGKNEFFFGYDAEGQTVYRREKTHGNSISTVSLGDFQMQTANLDGVCKYTISGSLIRRYPCIQLGQTVQRTGKGETFYATRDHLGSIETIYSVSKLPVERRSYDAFGNERDPNAWLPYSFKTVKQLETKITSEGYTQHQMLHGIGLIECGFRMYDPHLGRFLSPDPSIADLSDSQVVNPYSYANNNPLSGVDGSGLFFKKIFKKVIKPIVKLAVKPVTKVVEKVGRETVRAANKVGKETERAVKNAGKVVEKVGREAVRAANKVGKETERAVKNVGKVVEKVVIKPVERLIKPFEPILKSSANVFVHIALASLGCPAICLAAWSVIQTKLNGGSWSEALQNGLLTYTTHSIGKGDSSIFTKTERILIGGTLHGSASLARGGSFTSGFISGATEMSSLPTTWKDLGVDSFMSGVGAVLKESTHLYFQSRMREIAVSHAEKIGLDVDEMNLLLTGSSFLLGVRETASYVDNSGKESLFILGVGNHKIGSTTPGFIGDAVDTLLLYQGLPSATGWTLISSGNYEGVGGGHSLGSVEASVLLQYGFINHAILAANPIGQVSSLRKATVIQNKCDVVSGYRPMAMLKGLHHSQAIFLDVPINKNVAGHGFKEVFQPELERRFGLKFAD